MADWMLDVAGATLAGTSRGAGPGLVFLHAGVADRRSWTACSEAMAVTHRAVSYDRRGYGDTTYEAGEFSHLDDLNSVLDTMEIDAAIVVGNSMGGGLALDLALARPERCRALVLIGTAASGAPPQDLDPQTDAIASMIEAAEDAGNLDEVNRLEARLFLDGPTAPEGRVGGRLRELFLAMNGVALAAADPGAERPRPEAFDRLGEVEVPALVLVGSLDLPLMVRRSTEVARRLPGGEFVELPDVAHLPAFERPDLFVPVLREFVDGV